MKFDPTKSLDNALLKLDYHELRVRDKKIIYILHDPRPNDLRCYIGQTNNVKRFPEHYRQSGPPEYDTAARAKREWIRNLRSNEFYFRASLLEVCEAQRANDREMYWIGTYEESPFHILCNSVVDRAEACMKHGSASAPPLHPQKPGMVCEVASLDEVSSHWPRLIRNKIAKHTVETLPSAKSNREIWKHLLAPNEFTALTSGLAGRYTEAYLIDLGPMQLKINLYEWLSDEGRKM